MTKSYLSQLDIITSRVLHSERMPNTNYFNIFVLQVLIAYRMPPLGYKQLLMNKNVVFINSKPFKDYICLN